MFTPERGEVVSEDRVRKTFREAQAAAAVHTIRLHDTRATSATNLWSSGAAESKIQAFLGHQDVRVTQRYIRGYHGRGDEGALIDNAFGSRADSDVTATV